MLRRPNTSQSPESDLTLRSPPNWTAILFFAALGALHLTMASAAFLHGRWEGFLSLIFGTVFLLAAVACRLIRCEIAIQKPQGRVRLRTGFRGAYLERCVAFTSIQCVRLTLLNRRKLSDSLIEIVCDGEVIECPPTNVPRQEALCLAMLMGAHLVKVYGHGVVDVSERLNKLTSA